MDAVELIPAYDHPDTLRALFSQYTALLLRLVPDFQQYLDLQHYGDELRDLTAKYGPPNGRLYLARVRGRAAGCIALRRLDDARCEMKRLYVCPEFRGRGVARRLVEQVLSDARAIGCRWMLLDTLPCLEDAVRMYRKLGFYDIPRYNDSPLEDTLFLQLDL